MMATGEWSFSALISTHEPFILFPVPCPAGEGSDGAALVGTWHPARVSSPERGRKEGTLPGTSFQLRGAEAGVAGPVKPDFCFLCVLFLDDYGVPFP